MSITFVKVSIDFTLAGKTYKFENLDLIEEGIPELCKLSGSVAYDFRLDTSFEVTIKPAATFQSFKIESQIFVEQDKSNSVYGLKFISKNPDLISFLEKHGKPFTKWKRSSPRIPSSVFSQAVPGIKVMVKTDEMDDYTSLEILNISLGGIALFGTVDTTLPLKLNDVLLCSVIGESIKDPLDFTARVMRISTFADLFMNVKGLRVINQFGVKFVEFDEENKKKFLDLINKILGELKK
jgi:hypothetical protein